MLNNPNENGQFQQISLKNIQMANKDMKGYSTSLNIKECKSK